MCAKLKPYPISVQYVQGGLLTFVGGNKGRHVICGNVDIINKQPGKVSQAFSFPVISMASVISCLSVHLTIIKGKMKSHLGPTNAFRTVKWLGCPIGPLSSALSNSACQLYSPLNFSVILIRKKANKTLENLELVKQDMHPTISYKHL